MLHGKHKEKSAQAVSKGDAKKLRSATADLFSGRFDDVLDVVWDKKGAMTRKRWQLGQGEAVEINMVEGVPLLISIISVSATCPDGLPAGKMRGMSVPSTFFFLRARQFLANEPERYEEFMAAAATRVYCRGPTSSFIISGAHVMTPGILAVDNDNMEVGRLALVYSVGTSAPYAVGVVTENLTEKRDHGVGVYVINCYMDSLWEEYVDAFVASCSDRSGMLTTNPVPEEFCGREVKENLSALAPKEAAGDNDGAPSAETGVPDGGAQVGDANGDVAALVPGEESTEKDTQTDLFPNEDAVLQFAFCEGVKAIRGSTLPLPVTQFTAMVCQAYPRIDGSSKPIEFKHTKHKRALTFFQNFSDVVELVEESSGVHSIAKLHRDSTVIRDHNRTYKDFLATVQKPKIQQEERAMEMRLMADKKVIFNQKIISVEQKYRPHSHLTDELAHVLLEGNIEAVVSLETKENFPTLAEAEVEAGASTEARAAPAELPPLDSEVFSSLYSSKFLNDNLRSYIKARGLMSVNGGQDGSRSVPVVKLQGALAPLTTHVPEGEVPITDIDTVLLRKFFTALTEITIQTSVAGSTAMSEYIPLKRQVKNGVPPTVSMWTQRCGGNKLVTSVKNLGAYGFNLDTLSRAWSQRFGASCNVYDPTVEFDHLKQGTKIPLEVHIQGDVTAKMNNILPDELGIPRRYIKLGK